MQIVSDTTPISELYKIHHLELLRAVYDRILIPEAVLQELQQARSLPHLGTAVAQLDWIETLPIRNPNAVQTLRRRYVGIDFGEAAAIALAHEVGASRIIIDDKRARRVAQTEGLPLIGTVGVVLLGARLQRITTPQAQAILDQLLTGTAYISVPLYREACRHLQSQEP